MVPSPIVVAKVIAVAATGIHSGTSLSLATFIVPSLSRLPPEHALSTWIRMFHPAAGQALSALALTTVASTYLYFKTKSPYILGSVATLLATVPYTLLFIDAINKKLIKMNSEKEAGPLTQRLLQNWATAHHVRVVLSLLSFSLVAYGAVIA